MEQDVRSRLGRLGSVFVFSLGETDGRLAFLPLATLLKEFDALKALKDRAFAANFGVVLEAVVLGHGFGEVEVL